jgi:hypothetical protein
MPTSLAKQLLNLKEGQRVQIRIDGDYGVHEGAGTLTGRDRRSAGWWVTLDAIPPAWLRRFPIDSDRNKHVLVTRDSIVSVLPS